MAPLFSYFFLRCFITFIVGNTKQIVSSLQFWERKHSAELPIVLRTYRHCICGNRIDKNCLPRIRSSLQLVVCNFYHTHSLRLIIMNLICYPNISEFHNFHIDTFPISKHNTFCITMIGSLIQRNHIDDKCAIEHWLYQ